MGYFQFAYNSIFYHTQQTQNHYDNNTWLYRFMYSFFYGFVQNDDYTYHVKPTKKVNIRSLSSCSYNAFIVLNCDYDYFCGDMTIRTQYTYSSDSAIEQAIVPSQEPGFDYFGARYYASDLSVWLSVDMLDFKYQSMSPYIYTAGNPVMFIDADGNDWFKGKNGEIKYFKDVTGDFSDVETKQEWKHIGVMGMGLNEKNGKIIFYKSDGTQRETSRSLEGVDIHPTYASNTNNPSKSTNNKNGYIWNERDLKMWEYLKNGDDPISRYVQSQISQGYYPILSEQNFYDIYGYKTGRLMVFKLYLDMALEIGTDAPRGGKSISLRSKTIIKSPNKVKPPSFQKYLKMTTGKYKGGARGDNLRRGWSDYKWRYCN